MELKVYAKGRVRKYDAKGIYDGKGVTVLKGSKISEKVGAKVNPVVEKLRNNPEKVSKDMIVLCDISFRSLSTAANFVSGNISNGFRVWKTEDGKELSEMRKEKNA